MAVQGWIDYLNRLDRFILSTERHEGIENLQYIDYVIERLEMVCQTCTDMKMVFQNYFPRGDNTEQPICEEYIVYIDELLGLLQSVLTLWRRRRESLGVSAPEQLSFQVSTDVTYNRGRGRPKFLIAKEQIEYLVSLFFTWDEISQLLGISRMTLYRRRVDFGMMNDPDGDLSDEDLVSLIEEFRLDNPYVGESMTAGLLRSRGYKIRRSRIRSALRLSDPISSSLRWPGGPIQRRVYKVAGPNSLWHIDSHHKLIRWRFVTHGGIDGFSRLIVYLKCTNNVRSQTIYESFLEAVNIYHLPSRVRSDQGGENVLVAQHMLETRGMDRNSMIVGSSVHNQRIERLWKDVHSCVTSLYYRLFYYLENQNILSPLNELHIYALHYVFLLRINKGLLHFTNGWNNHPLRTTHNKCPHQLFSAGMLLLRHSGLTSLDYFDEVDNTYGIENDVTPDINNTETINVPRCSVTLTNHQLQLLRETIDPMLFSNNYGIDLYEDTVRFLQNILN